MYCYNCYMKLSTSIRLLQSFLSAFSRYSESVKRVTRLQLRLTSVIFSTSASAKICRSLAEVLCLLEADIVRKMYHISDFLQMPWFYTKFNFSGNKIRNCNKLWIHLQYLQSTEFFHKHILIISSTNIVTGLFWMNLLEKFLSWGGVNALLGPTYRALFWIFNILGPKKAVPPPPKLRPKLLLRPWKVNFDFGQECGFVVL